jgi:hypothetical protein
MPILDTALAGVERMVKSLPALFAIIWLPWLLGTVVLVILEVIVEDQLRLGPAPAWARSIVWAPFGGVMLFNFARWFFHRPRPAGALKLDLGRDAWTAALITGAYALAINVVDAANGTMVNALVPTDGSRYRWEDLAIYAHGYNAIAWILKSALDPCFFGLIVVLAVFGRIDLDQYVQLLREQPVRLFCVAVLAAAAYSGAWALGYKVLEITGAAQLRPVGMIPWRETVPMALLAELSTAPIYFLGFAIHSCILAEAFRRLLPEARSI